MNSVFLVVLSAMILIVILLRINVMTGLAILSGGLLIWLIESRSFATLLEAVVTTAKMPRTWDLLFCLYFVMCLEVIMRKSGSLKGMVESLNSIFSSQKAVLAAMPTFLGLLPSVGGARFSAPIVEEASLGVVITNNQKSAINLWFRHITEFSNPLMPGIILACGIANITIGDLITHIGWVTIFAFIVGWFVLISPLKLKPKENVSKDSQAKVLDFVSLFISLGPVLISFLLIVAFKIPAVLAMGIVVIGFIPILYFVKRPVKIKDIFLLSIDNKLFLNVIGILLFIQLITCTGTLGEIVEEIKLLGLSQPIVVSMLAFLFGLITGMNQALIAILMPIVALMSPSNVVLVGLVMVFGHAGQMVTPTHLCVLITVEYFKANLWRTIGLCGLMSLCVTVTYSAWTYFRYYS